MKKKDQLKNQIKILKGEGFSQYENYADEFINYVFHYQYQHSLFIKTIHVFEFMILNKESYCKESFLKPICSKESNKSAFSQDNMNIFYQRISILFKSPDIIDKLISRFSNSPTFEQYFANVFFPTIFIGFSGRIYQDYAKSFLINYFNYKSKFNSLLNQMSATFILSNFIFRDCLRETFIFELSNNSNDDKIENIIVGSFFKSLSKLTSQQNDILEFYFAKDEKASVDFIINYVLIPLINYWEFSPFFASNSILFKYDFPKTDEYFQIDNKKCILIDNLKKINQISEVNSNFNNTENHSHFIDFKRYFTNFLNGYKPSQEIFEINTILNSEPIKLPISKLDEFISEQIELIESNNSEAIIESIDYQDAFLIYNDVEFIYDQKYFEYHNGTKTYLHSKFSIEKKDFQFQLKNDPEFTEWKKIQERAIALEVDPIKLYKLHVNKDSQKVNEALNFWKEELQYSIDCRSKTIEMMKTVDLFMEEMAKMKIALREITIKFLMQFVTAKIPKFSTFKELMNLLFSESVNMIYYLLSSCWIALEEEIVKKDIILFLQNTEPNNQLNPESLIALMKKHNYKQSFTDDTKLSNIISAYISSLKEFLFAKFIVAVSSHKSTINPKGRLSISQNKVTKYIIPQVEQIVNIGALQLKDISAYDNYFSGLRLLAFVWLKRSIIDQFNSPFESTNREIFNGGSFHFVEFEPKSAQPKEKSAGESADDRTSENKSDMIDNNIQPISSDENNQNNESNKSIESNQNNESNKNVESNQNNEFYQNKERVQSIESNQNNESNKNVEFNQNNEFYQSKERVQSIESIQSIDENINDEFIQNDNFNQNIEGYKSAESNQIIESNKYFESNQNAESIQNNESSFYIESPESNNTERTQNDISSNKSSVNSSLNKSIDSNGELKQRAEFNRSANKTVNFNQSIIVPPLTASSANQKKRFQDEKNAILWDMLLNQNSRMVSICALICRANHLAAKVEHCKNEYKFWMPRRVISDIKQLANEFGIKEVKVNNTVK